jgi:diacylglycerol kinase (ATP)
VRCTLIYNPISGPNRHRRAAQMSLLAEALTNLGHQPELIPTTAPGSATILAQAASNSGAETIFACGGDGTIHEVLQGLVTETAQPKPTLGIIPFGTANALARHLRLSLDPLQAMLQQIHAAPQTIPVGKLQFANQTRYFTVMAGAGPDGTLVYNLTQKSSLGRMAYYLHSARLFATRRFHRQLHPCRHRPNPLTTCCQRHGSTR